MRNAVVAGQFYSIDREELLEQIESCFKHKLGKKLSKTKTKSKSNSKSIKSNFLGLISPHAGYVYSGPCATHGFAFMLKTNLPDTLILLGPNHTGNAQAEFSLSLEDFETPLGIIKNNEELRKELIKASKGLIQNDETAHKSEHSLEVQLPFLQYIYQRAKKEFKIIPIVLSTQDYDKCIKVAALLSGIIKKDSSIGVIASSDFTHYGPGYGFMPFSYNKETKKNLYDLDKKAIAEIINLNPEAFFQRAIKTTICGFAPIVVLTELSRILKKQTKLLKYYTSGDISKDYSSAVGYASIAFS
jgi:AmmeMemoRadiSam system protein B